METVAVEKVQELMIQRQKLEDEIRSMQAVLESQGVGMHEPLVDADDYPRSDIDIYAVRKARNRISCLRNDIRAVMEAIEAGLHEVHGIAREKKKAGEQFELSGLQVAGEELKSFLIVKSVTLGSPAKQAGLTEGDLIIRFGTITAENFTKLKMIGDLVQANEGKEIPLLVQRGTSRLNLTLIPCKWQGRGLLGCLIDAYSK